MPSYEHSQLRSWWDLQKKSIVYELDDQDTGTDQPSEDLQHVGVDTHNLTQLADPPSVSGILPCFHPPAASVSCHPRQVRRAPRLALVERLSLGIQLGRTCSLCTGAHRRASHQRATFHDLCAAGLVFSRMDWTVGGVIHLFQDL